MTDYRPEARIIADGIAKAGEHIGNGIADGLKAIAAAITPPAPTRPTPLDVEPPIYE